MLPPVLESPNEYLFDDTRLGTLGIRLPEEIAAQARLINRRLSFVERHLQAILVTTLLLIVILAILLFFLVQLRRKNRLLEHQTHHLRHQEQLIRESEERYRRLFELSEDPMLVIHDRHFVMANDATARLLGYADATELLRAHPPSSPRPTNRTASPPSPRPRPCSTRRRPKASCASSGNTCARTAARA